MQRFKYYYFKVRYFSKPKLGIVILNWNRLELLRTTFYSLLYNTTYPIDKVVIVDNASSDGSEIWIKNVSEVYPDFVSVILNDVNMGGEAINLGISKLDVDYIFISENDLEFLPGWQRPMMEAFKRIPNLGQLSPFSPFPQVKMGEVWEEKPYSRIHKYGKYKLYESPNNANIGTTCMIRSKIADWVKWKTRTDNTTGNSFRFPDDSAFSQEVIAHNYFVGWSGEYLAVNWGHNIYTWLKDVKYYGENYKAKTWFGIEGLNKRLAPFGYIFQDGELLKLNKSFSKKSLQNRKKVKMT